MRYEATFAKAFDAEGNGVDYPTDFLHHTAEIEDIHFVGMDPHAGTETWRYEVSDETAVQFEYALQHCEKVIEFKSI